MEDNVRLPSWPRPRTRRAPPSTAAQPQPISHNGSRSEGPKVHLVALGPLTNIGEAIQMVPGSFRSVEEIVISGGAVAVPGNLGDGGYYQTDNTAAEWNIYLDAFAAKLVFESGMKITLVPLDVTNRVRIDHSVSPDVSRCRSFTSRRRRHGRARGKQRVY